MDRTAGSVGAMAMKDRVASEVVRAWVERTCSAQGREVKVREPLIIAAAVSLLRGEPPGQTRQIGSTRSGSKRVRPRTAGRMIARSSTTETIAR